MQRSCQCRYTVTHEATYKEVSTLSSQVSLMHLPFSGFYRFHGQSQTYRDMGCHPRPPFGTNIKKAPVTFSKHHETTSNENQTFQTKHPPSPKSRKPAWAYEPGRNIDSSRGTPSLNNTVIVTDGESLRMIVASLECLGMKSHEGE